MAMQPLAATSHQNTFAYDCKA